MAVSWKIENLAKSFGPVKAVENFTVSLDSGKIYGLVGGNGAGKSTLVKLITGVLKPDKGRILKEGKEIKINSPEDARRHRIAAAYQEFSLVPDLPVINNIFLNIEPAKYGFISISRLVDKSIDFLQKLEVDVPLDKLVRELSPTEKQVVEILKALILEPQLLLLDEPTNYLSEEQRDKLFKIMIEMKKNLGTTIVFISHRLEEVYRVCEQAIVVRDGRVVGIYDLTKTSMDEIIKAMIGEVTEKHPKYKPTKKSEVEREIKTSLLSVQHIYVTDKVRDVSLEVKRGEIVGLAGLLGQGQSEFLRAIYGLLPYEGIVKVEGQEMKFRSPFDALKNGIVYVSGDTNEGVFLLRSIKENISLIVNLERGLFWPVNNKIEEKLAYKFIDELHIKCKDPSEPVLFLSGGNRQKVYLARGFSVNPKVLLLDDPLKGVDIETKKEILDVIKENAHDKAILFFASDIKEMLPIVDRVVVFFDGRIIGEFVGEQIREDMILEASIKGMNR
jgi:ABC-type sugar transport system ATPase subunit